MSTQRSASTGNMWATGIAIFAGAMLLTAGLFQVFEGIVALVDDEFYVDLPNYTFALDTTAWGWIHIVLGLVLALTGFFLFTGAGWARIVGVMLAVLSLLSNFLWLPYYPLWALVVIGINILVIWAICTFETN